VCIVPRTPLTGNGAVPLDPVFPAPEVVNTHRNLAAIVIRCEFSARTKNSVCKLARTSVHGTCTVRRTFCLLLCQKGRQLSEGPAKLKSSLNQPTGRGNEHKSTAATRQINVRAG
jgi:hypothetical protein